LLSPEFPVLDADALARFQNLRVEAIDVVTQRFYAQHLADYAAFGPRGREACREDLAFHLEFLRPVLEFGVVQPMVDYLLWLATVLQSRGVPDQHMAQSLDWLGEFFRARMADAHGRAVAAALRLARQRYLDAAVAAPPAEAHLQPTWPESAELQEALAAGDRPAAAALFQRCLAQGHSLVEVELHLLQPALYGIGRQWQCNEISVAQEHLATALALSLMNEALAGVRPGPANGKRVLLACVPGNHHSVGLQMVADAFLLAGWEVQYLGADVPTTALIKQVDAFRPHLLALSVSFAQQLRGVKEILARLAPPGDAARPAVLVGGLAVNQFEPLAARLGADAWSPDARAATARAEALLLHPGEQVA
jgi:methanogenic corrinoid protein MtbC1